MSKDIYLQSNSAGQPPLLEKEAFSALNDFHKEMAANWLAICKSSFLQHRPHGYVVFVEERITHLLGARGFHKDKATGSYGRTKEGFLVLETKAPILGPWSDKPWVLVNDRRADVNSFNEEREVYEAVMQDVMLATALNPAVDVREVTFDVNESMLTLLSVPKTKPAPGAPTFWRASECSRELQTTGGHTWKVHFAGDNERQATLYLGRWKSVSKRVAINAEKLVSRLPDADW